jgi:hypothetical protein
MGNFSFKIGFLYVLQDYFNSISIPRLYTNNYFSYVSKTVRATHTISNHFEFLCLFEIVLLDTPILFCITLLHSTFKTSLQYK